MIPAEGTRAEILRKGRKTSTYYEYRLLKPLATVLFRGVLNIAWIKSGVISILKNSALIVRGDFEKISDEQYRKCVII